MPIDVNDVSRLLVVSNGTTFPLHLRLEVPDHLLPHPYPHPVDQVQLVMDRLTAPPLLPAVSFKRGPGAITKPVLGFSDTQTMKSGSKEHPIIGVEPGDVVVKLLQLRKPVGVAWWWSPIVVKPDKLGRVQEGGDSKLVFGTWMVKVLCVNYLLEVLDAIHNSFLGPTLDEVIQASDQKHPHGPVLPVVVQSPGVRQV